MAKTAPQPAAKAEQTAPPDGADAGAAGSKKKKLLLIGGGVAALALVAGVLAFLFLGDDEPAASEVPAAPSPALYASLGEKFVVNLQSGGRQHYLQLAVSAMAREHAALDALGVHAPLVRARLISLFGAQDFERLRTDEGRQALRAEVLATIRGILEAESGTPGVEEIYFTEFVLQ